MYKGHPSVTAKTCFPNGVRYIGVPLYYMIVKLLYKYMRTVYNTSSLHNTIILYCSKTNESDKTKVANCWYCMKLIIMVSQ